MNNFHKNPYSQFQEDIYRKVRTETYGEDLEQSGWGTREECRKLISWLELGADTHALDLACKTGWSTLLIESEASCEVVGGDNDGQGLEIAKSAAENAGLAKRVRFETVDFAKPLPFPDSSFDALVVFDGTNRIPDRLTAFEDWRRLLKSGSQLILVDNLVITGPFTNQDIAKRCPFGRCQLLPAGENERLLRKAGFDIQRIENVNKNAVEIASRWRNARRKHRRELTVLEGTGPYEEMQNWLTVTHRLADENRLTRWSFQATAGR